MELKGHTAIITGAASGMGAETAKQLAKAGAKIALLDANKNSAEKIAKEFDGIAIECDVTNSTSIQNAIAKINSSLGDIRICVNCAGVATATRIVGKEGPMPLEDFNRVIEINLIGTFNVMRLAAASMSKLAPLGEDDERGVIINTASIAAYDGQIGQAAYSASKGGVVSMTLPAAREFAQFGIRVVTIAPGLIDTPMLQGLPEAARESLAASIPFPKRFGKSNEYAKLVLHIIDNPLLNGVVIRLDGALRMSAK